MNELPALPVLTVDVLKTLKFDLELHINGGDKYSMRVVTNNDYGISVSTETNGSPNYIVTSKEMYMKSNRDVVMDMRKKPWGLDAFVAAYNQAAADIARSEGRGE
jgi:hypothetical protein